ncbi:lysophospholipid acyltransferase family protein [Deinococcus arenicola]|uniref:Lysophospholipid acyltransferase family protein n=1 Tax=Deinococcus arenicola TaxID=2994950 RepID=A0ABU4DME8_9DEIO|nr:lysophospholipid acyltransferase family protein [Deinococcus sp. ZS9-10]MDV6373611.1 lysophospholipid acyltransferase family protein [Deinococcus sp. ZS9-10]
MPDRAPWATPVLKHSIRRSLRTGLGGVWVRGSMPPGGAVLAPNHNSWWDGYVMRELAWWAGADFRILMVTRQLRRFPFLRRMGALEAGRVREAAHSARNGAWVAVFPEGAVQPVGGLAEVHPGAAWIARTAGVPLIPVALRVVMRGGQWPEAYLRIGGATTDLTGALTHELGLLDAELAASDPEQPLAGYLRVMRGRSSGSDTVDWPARLLTLITGDQ